MNSDIAESTRMTQSRSRAVAFAVTHNSFASM